MTKEPNLKPPPKDGFLSSLEVIGDLTPQPAAVPPPADAATPPPTDAATPPPAEPTPAPVATPDAPIATTPPAAAESESRVVKGAEFIKQLKANNEQLAAKTKELEERLAKEVGEREERLRQLSEKVTQYSDYEEIKKQRDELDNEMRIVRVEATREYRESVEKPLARLGKQAEEIAKVYDADPKAIMAAVNERDPAQQSELLDTVVAGMREYDRMRVYELLKARNEISAKDTIIRENAGEALKKIEAIRNEHAAEQERQKSESYGREFDTTWRKLAESSPILQPKAGDDAWSQQVAAVQQAARSLDLDRMAPAAKAEVAIRASVLPHVAGMLQQLRAKNQQLEARVAEYEKALGALEDATPRPSSGTAPAPAAAAAAAADRSRGGFLKALQ